MTRTSLLDRISRRTVWRILIIYGTVWLALFAGWVLWCLGQPT